MDDAHRIKCGNCGTEFDYTRIDHCPLCKFGKPNSAATMLIAKEGSKKENENLENIPLPADFPPGKAVLDHETKTVGLWGMFNDYFSGKLALRVTANLIALRKEEFVALQEVVDASMAIIKKRNYGYIKGFPNNISLPTSVGRFVKHFIFSYYRLGLFDVRFLTDNKDDAWNKHWDKIQLRPSREGLEFSRLKNKLFDDHGSGEFDYSKQVLTSEESKWMINWLKKLDNAGLKEYTFLENVYAFIRKHKDGKDKMYKWLSEDKQFIAYLKTASKTKDSATFRDQAWNMAITFGSAKVSLLRELGVIKNKRNDYSIVGDL